MRQSSANSLFLLIFCLISGVAFGAVEHLTELKSKFPYGLLSDDYGILTVNDLAVNACIAEPRPFNTDNRYYPYEYWQCFESKTISFNCDSNGVPNKQEGVMGLIVMRASINHIKYEYIERRLWPIKDCKGFLKDTRALLKGIQHACVSGSFIGNETNHLGHQTSSWIFERIKTKKGCEGHDCKFTRQFKQDSCPDMKL